MKHSRYHILGEVGQGQFGKVFCGCDRTTGQLFALKSLDHRRFPTHSFLKELAILVQLNHPNIVSFHGVEYQKAGRYIVMDYCQGGTLRQLLESKTELSLVQKLGLVQDTLRGLEHIHEHRIIHCDLKPDNILLDVSDYGWTAKIADFGIARFLGPTGARAENTGDTGSPAYMAPERFYGRFSVESDLYAVGILLYELVSGHRPFSGMPLDVMKAHLNQPLRIPKLIPTLLKVVIRKALQKLPQHRYSSASEMRLMLEIVMKSLQHAPPQSVLQPLATAAQRPEPISSLKSRCHTVGPQGLIRTLTINPQDLKSYLTFDQVIHRLWWQPQGCMIATRAAEGFALWLNTKDTLQSLGTLPRPPLFLSESLSGCVDVDPQSRWVASTTQASQLQISRLSPLRPVKSIALDSIPEQIWITSNRHVLVAHQPTVSAEASAHSLQRLQLFNRRGQSYWSYELEGVITAATLTRTHSGQLFAITKGKEASGLLINLSPLNIKRISLDVCADWVCAADWGFILGDRLGSITCLNRRGRTVAQAKLPLLSGQTISATTFLEPATLLMAVREQEQATVMILDLSLHLPRSLLTL